MAWQMPDEPYVDPEPELVAPRVTPVTLDRRPVVQHAVKKPVAPSTRAMAEAQPRLHRLRRQPEDQDCEDGVKGSGRVPELRWDA